MNNIEPLKEIKFDLFTPKDATSSFGVNKFLKRYLLPSAINLCVVLPLMCVVSSCVENSAPENLPAERTVLLYIAGDNDVSTSLSAVVESIRDGWQYGATNCLIYLDAVDAPPKLLRVRGGCQTYPTPYIETVATYSEENSASAEVFSKIIDKVTTSYPATTYGLIFASHSTGWLPAAALANPNGTARSMGLDQNTGVVGMEPQEMELSDFARAIPDGMFDFMIFEACLTAGIEVAYELRHKTDYILASSAELLVPGFVPIYGKSQHFLFNTKYSVEQSITGFATDYYNYILTQNGAYRSTTLSVIKTSEIEPLASLLKGTTLTGVSLSNTQHFDRPGSYGDTPSSPRYFDLLHALQQTLPTQRYSEVETQLAKTIIYKAATPTILIGHNGVVVRRHCGLTTYIEQPLFPKLNEAYRNTAWYVAINK